MAAVFENDTGALCDLGTGVTGLGRYRRQREQTILLGNRLGGTLDTGELGGYGVADSDKEFIFQRDRSVLCAEDSRLQLF